ncbi:MAG TPA: hypothetical protein V6C88_10930 [Chroococcidiopsis sp.]
MQASEFPPNQVRDSLPPIAIDFNPGSGTIAPHRPSPEWVILDLQRLTAFETVEGQYKSEGVWFEGAIALYPSNSAFSPRPGALSLLPIAGRSNMVAHFAQPRQQVNASLTGARQVTVTAYDHANRVLAKHSAGNRNYVSSQPAQTTAFPQHEMKLSSHGIAKVTFDSDAPFTLDAIAYC